LSLFLEDQFQRSVRTSDHIGSVLALVYAERRGAPAAMALGRSLHLHFADEPPAAATDVRVIPVACLAEIPSLFHPLVRARVRQESPDLAVWLDFAGQMQRTFGLVPGVPNVAILDPCGQHQAVRAAARSEAFLAELAGIIDRLRH
jgi:hypothetical protein